jgi:hypothetical protein
VGSVTAKSSPRLTLDLNEVDRAIGAIPAAHIKHPVLSHANVSQVKLKLATQGPTFILAMMTRLRTGIHFAGAWPTH